jgi:hypothetical protein
MKTYKKELDECYEIYNMQIEKELHQSAIQMLNFIKGMEYAKKLLQNDFKDVESD